MKRRSGLIGSVRATRRVKWVAVAEKVDDEPESQQLGLSWADLLPLDIIAHILMRLPIKYVFICKCVCRSWKAMISDPYFAKLHFQHAPFGFMIRIFSGDRMSRILHLAEYEPEKFENVDDDQLCGCGDFFMKPECNNHLKLEHKFMLPLSSANRDETKKRGRPRRCNPKDDTLRMVNSCNGFLCLCDLTGVYFVVCNPVTGEFIRLPKATRIDLTNKPLEQKLYFGFGFQPKTNEYKVVRIHRRWGGRDRENIMEFEMHTLGASTWRNLGVVYTYFDQLRFPTCVSGALHWIGSYQTKLTILCFDFESDEGIKSFPSPPHLSKNNIANITMGELRGSLYICDSSSMDTPIRIWIMEKYGVEESWSPVFSVDTMSRHRWPYSGLYWFVKQFNNGAAILLFHSSNCFIYYEPKSYGFKVFKLRGGESAFEVISHIPSLTSLKGAVKGDNIEVLNVHSRCAKFNLEEENEVLFMAKVKEVTNMHCISSDDEE
ncbi:F-box protein At3g07870-like [Lotus japonicus]|uniref:F-box protein At3g07870-like n=1 Tax=Lotus japonicus TaxID=34305 RepID=UPI0025886FAB|nr:F-box protein At3g07870-like [Lotus japonicus]